MFYKTFVSMPVKQNLFVSGFVHKCLMMLNDVEYTFKMFVTQMSNYLFVISFQLMFYKTLRYRLTTASDIAEATLLSLDLMIVMRSCNRTIRTGFGLLQMF